MNAAPRHPLPPELRDELADRTEGQELVQVWDLLALVDPVPGSPEAEQVWSRVSAQIAQGRPILTPVSSPALVPSVETPASAPTRVPSLAATTRRRAFPTIAPWALAATLAVAAGLGYWQSRPITVEAPFGEQLAVTLPDGSVAELNAGTTLQYARGFRGLGGLTRADRAVTLRGEAYFAVTRSSRPFTVTTDEARITVLGTSFVVRAHADDAFGTLVGVESGRVRVEASGDNAAGAVELAAGQETLVRTGAVAPESASTLGIETMTLWRRGGLALVNLRMDAIFRELERRYAVDIRLRGVSIGDELLAFYYPERPSIETVLNDLCTMRGLRYTRTSRGFDITPQAESVQPLP